jgi:hypothetical protein
LSELPEGRFDRSGASAVAAVGVDAATVTAALVVPP